MLLTESYLETKEYKDALVRNVLSSTLIEIGKGGDSMNHEDWLKEGGIENPTHDETIAQECQQKRIQWLCENAVGDNILELGCNWGYILDTVCKYTKAPFGFGVDINGINIAKALVEFPDRYFVTRDITDPFKMHAFPNNKFNTVMLPDVLEHLTEEDALFVVLESLRIASDKVLITLPKEEVKKYCFKHKWIVGEEMLKKITKLIFIGCCQEAVVSNDDDFFYIVGESPKSFEGGVVNE